MGLVLTPAIYNILPNATNFVRHTRPGAFTPTNARLTQAEVSAEKSAHDELVRAYHECNAVEDTLRNQLIKAIPSIYLNPLRDPDTDMITETIPGIISFLQTNYCELTPEEINL